MPRRGARTAAVAIAAFGAASVWVSLGTLAAIQPDTRIRIIALPPLWLLALLVAGAAIAAWAARPSLERAAPLILSVLVWLPFLPGRVPAAFLIWQGPIEALVWLVVSAGVLYGTPLPRALSRVTLITNPRLAPWAAGFAAAVCYIGGSVALADRRPGGDEPHYLIIAESLRRDHDLRIQNNHDRLDYISFAPSQLDPHYVVRSTKGDIYSVHAPGLPALVVPAFALWGYAGASATVIAMTAAAGVLTWQAAWLLTASIGAAWLGWAAVVLTTPFFVHAFTVFPDGPGALGVSAGLWLLLQLEKRAPTNAVAVTLVATSLAVLPWLHSRLALPATALGLAIGWRLWQRRRSIADLVQFFAIPSLSALAWFGFFWVIWGTPNPNAPWGGMSNSVWRQVPPGLLGLIFHQQAGLISTAPVYVCAVIGVVGLARRHPRLAIELAAVTVPYALVVAGFAGWSGGFGGPARYLVAVLPLAALPTAWVWVAGGAVARTIALFLLLTSLAMLVPRIVMFRGSMVYAQHLSVDPLLAWAAHSVDLPAAFPDVRVAAAWQSVAVGLAVGGALLAPAAWVWRRPRPGPVATWIGVSLSAALWLMIVTTINWRLQHRDGIAAAKSQLAFVSQWNPGWQSTDIQWRPPYRVPAIQLLRRIDVPMTVVDGRANAPRAFVAANQDIRLISVVYSTTGRVRLRACPGVLRLRSRRGLPSLTGSA